MLSFESWKTRLKIIIIQSQIRAQYSILNTTDFATNLLISYDTRFSLRSLFCSEYNIALQFLNKLYINRDRWEFKIA